MLDEKTLRENIADNIAALRKERNMTQAQLAELLNYSDKSVSKWERGDGIPDVLTLVKIAGLFEVKINRLVEDPPKKEEKKVRHANLSVIKKSLITVLSSGLVWFAAAVLFLFLRVLMPDEGRTYLTFICALPASSIVFVVLSHILWRGNRILQCVSVSVLAWSIAVCVHLMFYVFSKSPNLPVIYVAAGVFQVLILLWYVYLHIRHKDFKNMRPLPDEEQGDGQEVRTDDKND